MLVVHLRRGHIAGREDVGHAGDPQIVVDR